ncbi:AlpA family transcriptional regulator [Gluconobacter cerinus]|uniref:helix-turn-helix transcriptional regulator n=1 Tax=Gluconobacter cerinus TaxID=38307 RepID=UPI001B8AE8EC|nr:AlpA family transcriptional regulator [Gluconobacter cerinus]MBS1040985.1 AlpA family transcriptional regulator [Gluconobacter cerinus]MBS1047954.1 AlpA family transcriptional regulator [Gluconobacter cerinus]
MGETYERLLTVREVQNRTGWSRATIYRHMADGTFPQPHRLSAGSVRWEHRDIEEWINSKKIIRREMVSSSH